MMEFGNSLKFEFVANRKTNKKKERETGMFGKSGSALRSAKSGDLRKGVGFKDETSLSMEEVIDKWKADEEEKLRIKLQGLQE